MKKKIGMIFLACLVIFGCNMVLDEPGSQTENTTFLVRISVQDEKTAARTILPSVSFDDVTGYELWGAQSGDPETKLSAFPTIGSASVELSGGTWNFTLKAFKNENLFITGEIKDKTIETAGDTLSFLLVPPFTQGDGKGNVRVTIDVSAITDAAITTVTVAYDTNKRKELTIPAAGKVDFTLNYAVGDYFVTFKFQNRVETIIAVISELIQIRKDLDSVKTIAITHADINTIGYAPQIVQLTPGDKSLVAQWTKVSNTAGRTASYEIWLAESPDFAQAKVVARPAASSSNLILSTIPNLENHKPYYVWVRSVYESVGASDFSPMASGTPLPPPVTPGAITVAAGGSMLDLKWNSVPDAFTYNVFYTQGTVSDSQPPAGALMAPAVSVAGAIVDRLTNGTTYTLWVQAENTAGKSGYSRSTGTPQSSSSAPAAPPVIKTITPGNGKLTLTWDQVPGVPEYTIFYNTTNNSDTAKAFSPSIPADSPTVTGDITGLTNETLYYIWVKSKNTAGSSGFSAPQSGTPQGKPPITWERDFVLGQSTGQYVFALDVPPSVFFPEGRPYTDRLPRIQESTLGNLFTDAAAWYVRERLGEQIDFVFLNGSFIDGDLPAGKITVSSIRGAVDTGARSDKITLISLTGAQLKTFFGVTSGDTPVPGSVAAVTHMGRGGANTGAFGMVSKELRYTIEYPKPPAGTSPELSGDDAEKYWHGRIKAGTLKLNGVDIVDNQTYRLCTTDYIIGGTYYAYNTLPDGTDKETFDLFYYAVAEYVYDKGTITPKLDGRIQLEGGVPLPPPWKNSDWNPYNN